MNHLRGAMQINSSRLVIAALLVSAPASVAWGQKDGEVVAAPADSDQSTIRSLEDVWAIAITQQDSSALVPILAPGYGAVTAGIAHHKTRAEALHDIAHPADPARRVTHIVFDSLTVRMVARDSAIAQGVVSESGQSPSGPFVDRLAFVDTFVRRKGRWVCVASRFTPLPARKV
jgi:hypothetical protein